MINPNPELRNLGQSLERYAARLNPGLSAVALALAVLLLGEATARLPGLYEQAIAAQSVPLTTDPTALVPANMPPFD